MSTCETCRHWHRKPVDPMNLGAPVQGECREHLHSMALPTGPGQLQIVGYYPSTPAAFPACGRHADAGVPINGRILAAG